MKPVQSPAVVFGIPHLNGIVPRDSVKSNLVAINLAHFVDRHLSADANWFWMRDRNLSLVIDFDALIPKMSASMN